MFVQLGCENRSQIKRILTFKNASPDTAFCSIPERCILRFFLSKGPFFHVKINASFYRMLSVNASFLSSIGCLTVILLFAATSLNHFLV